MGFLDIVKKEFAFLVSEYGFKLVKESVRVVKYESDFAFVTITYEYGYEIEVRFGLLPISKYPVEINLIDIMRMINAPEDGFIQASTVERIKEFVPLVAGFVKKYTVPALEGNKTFFNKVYEYQRLYFDKQQTNLIKQSANDAWRKKDFAGLIKIYSSIKQNLSSSEMKKFEYALKKMKTN